MGNGEGWKYSDRTNLMQKSNPGHNFPAFDEVFERDENPERAFFNKKERYLMAYLNQKEELEKLGHKCLEEDNDDVDDANNDPRICGKLNYAPNYFHLTKEVDVGVGTYDFISTRNNNFSNRAHTLNIKVAAGRTREAELAAQREAQRTAVAGGVAGFIVAVIVLGLIGAAVYFLFFRKNNDDENNEKEHSKPTTIASPKKTAKYKTGQV